MSDEHIKSSLQEAASDLARITRLANEPDQHQRFLHTAISQLCDALQFELVVALEFRNGLLHPRAAYRSDGRDIAPAITLDPRKYPHFQNVLEERRLISDVPDDQPADHSFIEGQCAARLIVPMISGDNLIGMLVLESSTAQEENKSVRDLATAYASIIANSLTLTQNIAELESTQRKLINQNRALQHDRDNDDDGNFIVMEDTSYPELKHLFETGKKAAAADVSILITGETGTGKDVLARALHRWSGRSKQDFVKVNCAALPENLIESELFGHVKGAFSGAISDRAGRFEIADGGTLLLDEVGDLPLETQAKLLRVLQEGTYQPVGSDETVQCDVRIIAATNTDLLNAIESGDFREDLYFRLNVVNLHLPPLRERIGDLPLLTKQILKNIQRRTGRGPWHVSPGNMEKLKQYSWPGNIRELVNVLERGRVFASGKGSIPVKLDNQQLGQNRALKSQKNWPTLKEHQRAYIVDVLKHTHGKIYGKDGAAALLDVPPTTLSSQIQRLNIDPKVYRVDR